MLNALLGTVLTTAARDMAGKTTGKARVSKTKAGAGVAVGTGIWAILPQVMAGDATAIGQLVLMAGAWAWTLYGRWSAEDE